ncbi:hypothetical protein BU17DRAFT_69086 [Hysterangium stoloniferum]|nr:hypothetical protein BU17DRAFT_69086 [Hysterangium stoloniferum]
MYANREGETKDFLALGQPYATPPTIIHNGTIWAGNHGGHEILKGNVLLNEGLIRWSGGPYQHEAQSPYGSSLVIINAKGAWAHYLARCHECKSLACSANAIDCAAKLVLVDGQAFPVKLRTTTKGSPSSKLIEQPGSPNSTGWKQTKHSCGENPIIAKAAPLSIAEKGFAML